MVYRPLRYEDMMKAAEGFDVRARRMFDGMAVFAGEKMFAYLVDDEIGLKLPPQAYEEAMGMDGACALQVSPESDPMPQYVRMPREVLDDYDAFVQWVQLSVGYAQEKVS